MKMGIRILSVLLIVLNAQANVTRITIFIMLLLFLDFLLSKNKCNYEILRFSN